MGNLEIIDKAKEYLKKSPIDAAHGLEHHEAVAENCIKIINGEHLNVNITVVMIAAWWHDVESQQGATDLLQKEIVTAGFDPETVKSISATVSSHTYGKHQGTIEERVLFDADKMEYFNPDRIRSAVEDARKGLLPIPILAKHYQAWLERYQDILQSFNFEYSREAAHRNLAATLKEIEKMRIFLESVSSKD